MNFFLTDKQLKQSKKFIKQQNKKMTDADHGSIGGAYTYHITPTSIGTVIKLENSVTKANIDLSEYDLW